MAANWTVLNTLVASTWIDRPRVWPNVDVSRQAQIQLDVPGPMIVLRPALPNVPGAGIENAAVLKNSAVVGSLMRDRRAVVVGAQRAVDAAGDVDRVAEHARRERRARRERARCRSPPSCRTCAAGAAVEPRASSRRTAARR